MRDLYRLLLLCLFALSVLSDETKAEEAGGGDTGNFLKDNAQKIAYASLAVLATVFFIAKGTCSGSAVGDAPVKEPAEGDEVSVQVGLKDDGERYDAIITKIITEGEGDKKVIKYVVKNKGSKGPKTDTVLRGRFTVKRSFKDDQFEVSAPLTPQQALQKKLEKITEQFKLDLQGVKEKEARSKGVKQDKYPVSVDEAKANAIATAKKEKDQKVRDSLTAAIQKLAEDTKKQDAADYKKLDAGLRKLMETHKPAILRKQALIGHRVECRGSAGLGHYWGRILEVKKDRFILHDGDYEDDSTPDKKFSLCWWEEKHSAKTEHTIRAQNSIKAQKTKSDADAKKADAAKAKTQKDAAKKAAPKKDAKPAPAATPAAAKPAATKATTQSSS